MQNSVVETLIGAAVLIVAAGFLYFAYTSTGAGSVAGYEISAKFGRVDGIAVGSDVRMSGVKIGTVTGIEIDPEDYSAIAHFSVANNLRLPEDSSARITTEGIMGNQYISVEPGGSETMLEPGGQIEYTQGSIDLMGLLGRTIFGGGEAGAGGAGAGP